MYAVVHLSVTNEKKNLFAMLAEVAGQTNTSSGGKMWDDVG